MSRTSVLTSRAERVEVDAATATYLPGVDYADAFATESVPGVTAREWARMALQTGPEFVHRTFGALVWHGVLGFELAAPEVPGTMVGWRIVEDQPDLFVLTADGRMAGTMIFRVSGVATTWTTAVRYQHPSARRIWAQAQRVHRTIAARLLPRAAAALRRRT